MFGIVGDNRYQNDNITQKIKDICKKDSVADVKSIIIENYPKLTYHNLFNLCIAYSCPNICKFLIEQLIDNINVKNIGNGFTSLHFACFHSNFNIVKLLCQRSELDINLKNNSGKTALHLACRKNLNLNIVKYLISKGAYVNTIDKDNQTPLSYACQFNAYLIISELISNPNTIIDKTNEHINIYMNPSSNLYVLLGSKRSY